MPRSSSSCAPSRIAGLEQQRSEPSAIAFTAFQKLLKPYPKGDIRYVDSVDEGLANIKAVTREQLVQLPSRLLRRQPAQIAAVGDFDADSLRGAGEAAVWRLEGAEAVHARAGGIFRRRP